MRRVEWSLAPVATFAPGSASDMKALQERLMAEGIYVLYSTYVDAGSSGVIREHQEFLGEYGMLLREA